MRNPRLESRSGFTVVGALALLAGMAAHADYSSAVLADGPVAYYRFSEPDVLTVPYPSATNLGTVGAAGDGTDATTQIVPTILKGVSGALADAGATAFRFPGNSGNRVRVPHSGIWNPTEPFTVELWAKPGGTSFGTPAASANFSTATRSGWILYQSDTTLSVGSGWMFRVYVEETATSSASAAVDLTIDTNAWYHLVGVYDGVDVKLYVDGSLAASTPVSSAVRPNMAMPLTFGARGDGAGGYWEYPGDIDEAAFYAHALSESEVASHYAAATTNAVGYAAQILAHAPAGYWRFNELFTFPLAANNGSAGAALDATYHYWSTTIPGLQSPEFGGLEADNTVVQLSGTNGFLSIPAPKLNANTVTFETFLKRDGNQAAWTPLVFYRNGANTSGFQINTNQLGYYWNNANHGWVSGLLPTDGAWTYAALAIGPSQAAIYTYDGTTWRGATNLATHAVQAFAGPLLIGWDTNAATRFFKGQLDEVAIYRKTLTSSQLRSHAVAAFGQTQPPVLTTDPPLLSPANAVYASESFTLSAEAYGVPPLAYQWRKDGLDVVGATNATYSKSHASTDDSGNYDIIVTNPYGSTTSAAPKLVIIQDPAVDISSGLRLWLKFDETSGSTASDSSGGERGGTLQNFSGDAQWVPGRIGNGVVMNPSSSMNQVVTVPHDSALDFSAGKEFTLAAWVNAAATQISGAALFAKGTNLAQQFCLDVSGGSYRLFIRQAVGSATTYLTSVKPDNFWHHVAAVYSAPLGRVKIYLDGVEVLSGTPVANLLANDREVAVGARQSGDSVYDMALNATLDDARIYGRALTPKDVAALYNLAPNMPPTLAELPQSRSVFPGGAWTFSALAGGTIPLSYQWKHAGTNLPGANYSTLLVDQVDASKAGSYSVTVTNIAGSANASANLELIPVSPGSYEALLMADQPVSYWRLNETGGGTIYDSMGRHDGPAYAFNMPDADGTWFGFNQTGALADNPDPCVLFKKDYQDVVKVPYSDALNTPQFTVECWARINSASWPAAIFSPLSARDIQAGANKGYCLMASGTTTAQWEAWMGEGGASWAYHHGPTVQPDTWVHLAATYDGHNGALYVNGVLSEAKPVNFVPNVVQRFYIGASANEGGGGNYFDGFIDEVAYYQTALSPAQIGAHYGLGVHGANSVPVIVQAPASQTVEVGQPSSFTASVLGAPTLTCKWQKDGIDIPGATGLTLNIPVTHYTDAGQYQLAAANDLGGAVSSPATLLVTPPAWQTNLAVHATSGPGGAVLELTWPAGTLYSAPDVIGPWTIVDGAPSPYYLVSPTNTQMFYRVQ